MAPRNRRKAELREARYRELMRQGMTSTAACRVLGVGRHTGKLIRRPNRQQTVPLARLDPASGRYLSLHEQMQIADLLRLGCRVAGVPGEA